MSLPAEFEAFYANWTAKAAAYIDESATSYFDRFITQFVLYNRLYVEATARLSATAGSGIQLEGRDSFPDGPAAKAYVSQFLTANYLVDALEGDPECLEAISELKRILREHQFFVRLHPVSGARQPNEDIALLGRLESTGRADKAGAILEFIYSIRCNLMHGQKDFSEDQVLLLRPTTILLTKVCNLLYEKLRRHDS